MSIMCLLLLQVRGGGALNRSYHIQFMYNFWKLMGLCGYYWMLCMLACCKEVTM